MRKSATWSMALVSTGGLIAAGILLVIGVVDSANPWSGIYFFFAAAAALAGGLSALTARALWRDRAWAWVILGVLGFLIALAAWQINQSFYGDGSLLSLTPITPYLAPLALVGLALLAMAAGRALAGPRNVDGTVG